MMKWESVNSIQDEWKMNLKMLCFLNHLDNTY